MGGGQNRTIRCCCGWTNKGIPDRLDTAFRLHKKKCNLAQQTTYIPSQAPFNICDNGSNDIKVSKHHNFKLSPNTAFCKNYTDGWSGGWKAAMKYVRNMTRSSTNTS